MHAFVSQTWILSVSSARERTCSRAQSKKLTFSSGSHNLNVFLERIIVQGDMGWKRV